VKVLFVLPEYGDSFRGGIATFYRNVIPALAKNGCEIDVCLAGPGQDRSALASTAATVIPMDPGSVKEAAFHLRHLAPMPELQQILARAFAAWKSCEYGRSYDVVEATDWGLLYVPWVIQESGPPVIVQLHGSNGQVSFRDPIEGNELEDLVTRTLEMALLGRADELQSGGRANAEEWAHLLCRPVHHIWPSCTPKEVIPASRTAGLEPDTFGLVVGRIQSWKGPGVLCRASTLLGDATPTIVWAGRDHPFRRLDRSLSGDLRKNYPGVWGRSIVPAEEMPPDEITAAQAAAKFVVVPSTWDTFNLTAAEAMGLGKVVICSEGAGAADLIKDGENGFTFPANDDVKLASLLNTVNQMSAADRAAIGIRARDTIRQKLAVGDNCAQRLYRYTQLRTSRRPARGSHPWLDSFFAPDALGAPLAFLNKVPLKQLIRHVGRRAGHRLLPGTR